MFWRRMGQQGYGGVRYVVVADACSLSRPRPDIVCVTTFRMSKSRTVLGPNYISCLAWCWVILCHVGRVDGS